ncbi:hypothetical protein RHGRI_022763 [Rhododendron griersonianum]|uniref:Transcription factor GTE8 n=1 Tax=Rhododendron griersonianum TaxID=479676 RepID=A0AAV6J0N9_9ERIC|nr:hypothetical protein RHGRI_022763 [Rhododendron griersonianum]
MAKKGRLPGWGSSGLGPTYVSEGSGSSGQVDAEIFVSEGSSAPMRKCISLNYPMHDGFAVPIQALPLSKMSSSQRKDLVLRLRDELERIRSLQKRVEMQRTNVVAVSSSSDILSCSNPQNGPSVENFKKSSGLTSGSGRKANPSDPKRHGWNRSTSGKFESASQTSVTPSASNAIVMKQCDGLLKKLMEHQHGWVFNTPVDVVKFNIPDYFIVIKNPMDLGTIKSKIASSEYSSPLDFAADVRLTFSNAMTYNQPGNDVHFMADTLCKFFEVRWKVIEKKLTKTSQPSLEKSSLREEKEAIKPLPPSKRRKIVSVPQEVMPHPVKRTMTEEEKHKLSRDLEASLGDLPDKIVEFLKEQFSNGMDGGEDEIEIDIDNLSSDALFTLQKLLDDHLQDKQKNKTAAEPCEIEVLNDSGPSNSSLQLCKGNDPADDEVDIGGNEPPVSSYPPVEIEKDVGHRSNTCLSPGRSRGSSGWLVFYILSLPSSPKKPTMHFYLVLFLQYSESESDGAKASTSGKQPKVRVDTFVFFSAKLIYENSGPGEHLDEKTGVVDLRDGN